MKPGDLVWTTRNYLTDDAMQLSAGTQVKLMGRWEWPKGSKSWIAVTKDGRTLRVDEECLTPQRNEERDRKEPN